METLGLGISKMWPDICEPVIIDGVNVKKFFKGPGLMKSEMWFNLVYTVQQLLTFNNKI